MYRLIVCYGHPDNRDAFDQYYNFTHRPLADKIPGVRQWHAGKCATPDGSKPPYYLVAELVFDSKQALEAGLASPEGQAAAADIDSFATGGVTMFIADDWI